MKRFDSILLFLLFLSSLTVSGGETSITLKGESFKNAYFTVHLLTDPVTQSEYPVTRGYFGTDGEVTVKADVSEISLVYIRSGAFRFTLLVSPGYKCTVRLPEYIPRPDALMDNPFYEETVFIPEVLDDPADRNNLIRNFDKEYNNVFNAVVYRVFNDFQRDQLPAMIEKLNSLSSVTPDKWFSSFVNSRMLMLNLVAKGETHGRLEDSVIVNREFNPYNPAYTDLVNQMYSGLFTALATGSSSSYYSETVYSLSPAGMRLMLGKYASVSSAELADYVFLLNMHSAYWTGSIPKDLALAWFVNLGKNGASEYIKKLSTHIFNRLELCMPGSGFPDPGLPDTDGTVPDFKLLKGKPSLFAFINPTDPLCAEEMQFFSRWAATYSGQINILLIIINSDFKRAAGKLKAGFPRAFILDGGTSGMMHYRYGLKMLPTFMLTDRDNLLQSCQAPLPSENLESVIKNLLKQIN
jgi:thiol-disulfide isomerase/thioredoxin